MSLKAYRTDLDLAKSRVNSIKSHILETPYGSIQYSSYGKGLPVLWVHGIVGGCDQGPFMSHTYIGQDYHTISVSRFGYLSTPLPEDSSPTAQADQYSSLLESLNILKIIVVGTSAGAPSSLQFCLRHPKRCAALVLLSMAIPPYSIPSLFIRSIMEGFYGSDYLFWLMINNFPSVLMRIMGVPKNVRNRLNQEEKCWIRNLMHSLLPVSIRKKGILNDIWVPNTDLKNSYAFESLSTPTLIIHAVDDPISPFDTARQFSKKIPNARFLAIEDGGHLLFGSQEVVRNEIAKFIKEKAGQITPLN